MHPGPVFHAVEFTLWEYENKLDRKYIFSLRSSMVSISISISFRTAFSSAIQFRIFVLSKSYALICNRTWLKAEFTAKHFYIKSAIKRIQLWKIKWTRRKITCVRITRGFCFRSRYVLVLWQYHMSFNFFPHFDRLFLSVFWRRSAKYENQISFFENIGNHHILKDFM